MFVNQKRNIAMVLFAAFYGLLFMSSAHAGLTLGEGGGALFAPIVALMQEFIDFIDGVFVIVFIFGSLVVMAVVWAVAPQFLKSMGVGARILIASVLLANVAVIAAAIRNGTG